MVDMTKRIIIKDGKKYIVNVPSWDNEDELEQANMPPPDVTPVDVPSKEE